MYNCGWVIREQILRRVWFDNSKVRIYWKNNSKYYKPLRRPNNKLNGPKKGYHFLFFPPIRHLHISHNAPYLPPKVCISIVFNFSWDGCNTQEKWKTKVMQNLGGQISCTMGDVQVAYVGFTRLLGHKRYQNQHWKKRNEEIRWRFRPGM